MPSYSSTGLPPTYSTVFKVSGSTVFKASGTAVFKVSDSGVFKIPEKQEVGEENELTAKKEDVIMIATKHI